MCLCPITIVNPHWKKVWQEQGRYDPTSAELEYYPLWMKVPCGKCHECRRSRGSGWRTRLIHEIDLGTHKNAYFVTFTIAPKYYDEFVKTPEKYVRRFLENYRKRVGKSLRHWFVTELGENTARLHLHGIVFDCRVSVDELQRLWRYGFSYIGWCDGRTASYVVKYVTKENPHCPDYCPRVFASPGLGLEYTLSPESHRFHAENRDSKGYGFTWYCVNRQRGFKMAMPRYYRERIIGPRNLQERARWLRIQEEAKVTDGLWEPRTLYGVLYMDEMSYNRACRSALVRTAQLGLSVPSLVTYGLDRAAMAIDQRVQIEAMPENRDFDF